MTTPGPATSLTTPAPELEASSLSGLPQEVVVVNASRRTAAMTVLRLRPRALVRTRLGRASGLRMARAGAMPSVPILSAAKV